MAVEMRSTSAVATKQDVNELAATVTFSICGAV